MVIYGQFVVGAPGAGKTTYCSAMKQLCKALDREVCVVNMDPANDISIYPVAVADSDQLEERIDMNIFDIDVRDLIQVEDIMEEYGLGPNGSLLYAATFLYDNIDWLIQRIKAFFKGNDGYIVFDCPGQVELFSVEVEGGLKKILSAFTARNSKLPMQLTAVYLMDSTLIVDANTYISALLVALNGQIMLELPCVNFFAKVDLLRTVKNEMEIPLKKYLEADDIECLLEIGMNRHISKKRRVFMGTVLEMIQDSNMVSFSALDIHDRASMISGLQKIDKGNGYLFGAQQSKEQNPMNLMASNSFLEERQLYNKIIETYIESSEDV